MNCSVLFVLGLEPAQGEGEPNVKDHLRTLTVIHHRYVHHHSDKDRDSTCMYIYYSTNSVSHILPTTFTFLSVIHGNQ